MTAENSSNDQVELISLIKNLVYNFVSLIFQHIKLFREEAKEEAFTVIKALILIWAAICISFMAVFFVGILLIIIFSMFVPVLFSLLIVTILFLLMPVILFVCAISQFKKIAKKRKKFTEETAKTLEETKKWLEQLKS
jgi:uncharacterized membrane protein YqjE